MDEISAGVGHDPEDPRYSDMPDAAVACTCPRCGQRVWMLVGGGPGNDGTPVGQVGELMGAVLFARRRMSDHGCCPCCDDEGERWEEIDAA